MKKAGFLAGLIFMFLFPVFTVRPVYGAEADINAALAMQSALALQQIAQQNAAAQQSVIAAQNNTAAQQSAIAAQNNAAAIQNNLAMQNNAAAAAAAQAQKAAAQAQKSAQQSAAAAAAAAKAATPATPAATTTPAVPATDGTADSAKAGGTYIDVNKTTQTLTYFVGGNVTYITPIVTGNVRAGHSTPNGVYNVYAKQTNRTLKGPNYSSFVKYWMPFYKGYGIHDANWRSSGEFGGTTYQTSGSHGCVNIPPANMPSLFSVVAVGTPVIVHE